MQTINWNEINVQPAQNMSDKIFHKISQMIMSGQLPEGYVFPNEAVLCEQLHVGRSTIREAYKALELYGYVTRSKKGTFVSSKLQIFSATPMKVAFSNVKPKDFNEFRQMLEEKSAELAAVHASSDQIVKLDKLIAQGQAAYTISDMERLMQSDAEFHRVLSQSSGNELIVSVMTVMILAWDEGIRRNFFYAMQHDASIFESMNKQHTLIMEAIKRHDPDEARQAMKTHIIKVTAQMHQ